MKRTLNKILAESTWAGRWRVYSQTLIRLYSIPGLLAQVVFFFGLWLTFPADTFRFPGFRLVKDVADAFGLHETGWGVAMMLTGAACIFSIRYQWPRVYTVSSIGILFFLLFTSIQVARASWESTGVPVYFLLAVYGLISFWKDEDVPRSSA